MVKVDVKRAIDHMEMFVCVFLFVKMDGKPRDAVAQILPEMTCYVNKDETMNTFFNDVVFRKQRIKARRGYVSCRTDPCVIRIETNGDVIASNLSTRKC
jgi:hypothetical protein